MINGRIEGWRALEEFTGLKEHRLRRAIGHYDFPKPRPEVLLQASTHGRTSITNVWHAGEVLIWIHIQNMIPSTPLTKEQGHGKQNHGIGHGSEPRGASQQLKGVRG